MKSIYVFVIFSIIAVPFSCKKQEKIIPTLPPYHSWTLADKTFTQQVVKWQPYPLNGDTLYLVLFGTDFTMDIHLSLLFKNRQLESKQYKVVASPVNNDEVSMEVWQFSTGHYYTHDSSGAYITVKQVNGIFTFTAIQVPLQHNTFAEGYITSSINVSE